MFWIISHFKTSWIMCLQNNVPFEMFKLERSEIKPNSSQYDLSSVIQELHWAELTVVVVYLEVISILFMVMGGKEGNMQLPLCLQRAVEFRQLPELFICLPASFEVLSHRSNKNCTLFRLYSEFPILAYFYLNKIFDIHKHHILPNTTSPINPPWIFHIYIERFR